MHDSASMLLPLDSCLCALQVGSKRLQTLRGSGYQGHDCSQAASCTFEVWLPKLTWTYFAAAVMAPSHTVWGSYIAAYCLNMHVWKACFFDNSWQGNSQCGGHFGDWP